MKKMTVEKPKPFKVQKGEEIIEEAIEECRKWANGNDIHLSMHYNTLANKLKNKLVVDKEFMSWLQSEYETCKCSCGCGELRNFEKAEFIEKVLEVLGEK